MRATPPSDPAEGLRADESAGMGGEFFHACLVAEDTAFSAFAGGVYGKHGQFAALFQYMKSKHVDRCAFTRTGDSGYADAA